MIRLMMNDRQRMVVLVYAIIIAILLLFPPFYVINGNTTMSVGYAFFLLPPGGAHFAGISNEWRLYARIDHTVLSIQLAGATLVAAAIFLWSSSKNTNND